MSTRTTSGTRHQQDDEASDERGVGGAVGPFFVDAGGEHIKDIEADDDSLMTGC